MTRTSWISQEDGARIMAAAENWKNAHVVSRGAQTASARDADKAAKQAFGDLIASLTNSEGL